MLSSRKIILSLCSAIFFISSHAQTDSVFYQKDSVIEPATDPTIHFFQVNEKIAFTTKTFVITKARKTVDLALFQKKLGIYAEHVLADLDNDGKKELLLYNYTGGAHCCDEVYIFRNTAPNKYQHVARLFAGNTVIADSNQFYYNLHEQFGYFFTCFACTYEDTADDAPINVNSIELKYKKGILSITRGDQELRSKINDNLGKLGEQPYEKLDGDLQQDNGLRKEFALNLAVFYFSFGKNIVETQRLFNKYYKFPDSKKIWTSFVQTLMYVKKDSDL